MKEKYKDNLHIHFQLSEVLFLMTGIFMLASLPFLESLFGTIVWISAKAFYFMGISIFAIHIINKKRKEWD